MTPRTVPGSCPARRVSYMVDGGMLSNFPIEVFDRYVEEFRSGGVVDVPELVDGTP